MLSGPVSHPVPLRRIVTISRSYNPGGAVTPPVWALSRSLATTWEITIVFSSCAYLDVSVQRVGLFRCHAFSMAGSPIRKSPDRFLFADPRRFSQLIASFLASESLGIPRVPFLTFFSRRPFAPGGMLFVSPSILQRTNARRRSSGHPAPTVAVVFSRVFSSSMSKNFLGQKPKA